MSSTGDADIRPTATIAMVAMNQADATSAAVRSLLGTAGTASIELLLWDNGSTDPAALELLVDLSRRPDVRVIRSATNEGWIKPINAMAAQARGRYFIGVNNDVVAGPGWLDALVGTLEADPRIAVAGPPPECGRLDARFRGRRLAGRAIDYIEGYCFAMRTEEARSFGPYDDVHLTFAYCEDADLCLRVREAGRTIAAVSACRIAHHRALTRLSNPELQARAQQAEARNQSYMIRRWSGAIGKMRRSVEAIVVRRIGAIGDVLACEPALRALRAANPTAQIVMQTRCGPILQGNPLGVEVGRRPTTARVRAIDLDLGYERRPGVPRCRALCEAAGVAYPGPPRYWTLPHAVEAVARSGVLPGDGRPTVALHAGASWPCRRWPMVRWRELARRLERRGVAVVSVGGANEATPGGVPFLGRPWPEVAALLARCSAFVGVDGSPMWVAAGLDVPGAILWGPTDPTLVLPDVPTLVPVQGGHEADGCHHRGEHPKISCACGAADHLGMLAITVDQVEAAGLALIEQSLEAGDRHGNDQGAPSPVA